MSEMLRGIPFDYEPIRENRYFLEFPSELGIESWACMSFKAPSMKINSVNIDYMNTSMSVAGRYTWDEMDITLLNVIGPSTTQQVMEWVRLCAESLTGRMGYCSSYSKDLILKILDPTGVQVSKWLCEKCQITNVDFGDFDYSSDEVSKTTITVKPFRCILQV